MELREEVQQSYLSFCNITANKDIIIEVNYDPLAEELIITEKGTIYHNFKEGNFDKGIPDEWDSTTINNKYTFTVNRQGEDTILEYIKSTCVSKNKGNSDGAVSPKTYTQYEPKINIIKYRVPAKFRLEEGIDPSIITEIKEPKEPTRRIK